MALQIKIHLRRECRKRIGSRPEYCKSLSLEGGEDPEKETVIKTQKRTWA
jgi:hypothetical protein